MGLFDNRRAETPEWQHADPKIRRAAVARLGDPSLLSQLALGDADEEVRRAAWQALQDLALTENLETAMAALETFSEETPLIAVARQAARIEVARAALGRLSSPHALALVAKKGSHPGVRKEALDLLGDPVELGNVALKTEDRDMALAALARMEVFLSQGGPSDVSILEILGSVAERARNKAASRRARALLRGGEEPVAAHEVGRVTDRLRQKELCETMEALGRSTVVEGVQKRIEQVRGEWIDLVPQVDPDFEERFEAAWHAAKENIVRLEREESERREREAEAARIHQERVLPRLDLIRGLESLGVDEIEAGLAESRADWDRLRFLDTEEGEVLQARFEETCKTCEERLRARSAEREALHAREVKEAARKEKEWRAREDLRRLEQTCARGEKLLAAESPTLKAAARALREVRAALESPAPTLTARDKAGFRARLTRIQAGLLVRVNELRQSEAWKLWANEGVQEDLCRRAEDLTGIEDPVEAGRQLTDLQARWRQASTASREKSQELWLRFKAARDSIRSRLESSQQEQTARKEALCAQAEALSLSNAWIPTAEALKRLQAEWKTVPSAGRSRDRALWQRFRGACDRFFTRRKEDLKQRKESWAKNLEARLSLCSQAEALADSSEWDSTAGILKRLQTDWKAIGSVGRKDSEETWRRFRGACDRFFERYKRRHEIERAAQIVTREQICRELESLIPAEISAVPEALPDTLRALQKRWAAGGSVPPLEAKELEARFQRALDGVITAHPEPLRESEFDLSRNRAKMEELIAQLEKLMPERNAVDHSALSPATRLATLWVEAMAANTIGGSVADDAQLRAAQDEVRRAQSVWEKIGYVSPALRRELSERFQRACGRILKNVPAEPSRPSTSPRRSR
ncbi:MAG: DUF349 domain-containing protein [Acidobacteria bacterium]|nr:DUF349 domain-containing protein [Acidobacteriota bacterium]